MDLNGAFAGKPKNEAAIKSIVDAQSDGEIPVQLGGGIRDLDTIERYLDDGISYIIIGTAAVKNPGFLHDACSAFPGQIIVGLDAKDGKVAIDGWSKLTGHEVIDLAKKFEDYGVEADRLHRHRARRHAGRREYRSHRASWRRAMTIPVIACGGVHQHKDVKALCAVEDEGIDGRDHRPRDLRRHAGFRRAAAPENRLADDATLATETDLSWAWPSASFPVWT